MLVIIVSIVFVGLLLLVLIAIIRFSLVSSLRMRGTADRLQQHDADAVERICGFPPPIDLLQMYREGRLPRLVEFSLIDKSQQPSKTWFVGGFYPLTGPDVLEQRKIHGISDGIPMADDLGEGVYFVDRHGAILFRPPLFSALK
jgi:hypothetical protein